MKRMRMRSGAEGDRKAREMVKCLGKRAKEEGYAGEAGRDLQMWR